MAFSGAGAPPVPVSRSQKSSFPGAGHGTNRPWEPFFRGDPQREPSLKMIFPGAVDAITRPKKFFYRGGSKHEPPLKFVSCQTRFEISDFCFPLYYSIQISVSRQFILIRFPLYLIILIFISRQFSPVKQLRDSIQLFKILFPLYLNLCFPPIYTCPACALLRIF